MSTYLDETTPADSEAVTLGASRIRQLKVELDSLIEQIWENTGTFLPGWIKANGATGGVSLFTPAAIQTADIAPGAITTPLLAPGSVTNTILAPGAVTTASLAAGFTLPAAIVTTAAIAAQAVGTGQMALASVTAAILATGLVKGAAVGAYAGTTGASTSVNTLGFNPTVLIILDQQYHGIGMAFQSEVAGGVSQIHDSWDASTTLISAAQQNTVQWQTGGFVIVDGADHFNFNGHTYTYLALAI